MPSRNQVEFRHVPFGGAVPCRPLHEHTSRTRDRPPLAPSSIPPEPTPAPPSSAVPQRSPRAPLHTMLVEQADTLAPVAPPRRSKGVGTRRVAASSTIDLSVREAQVDGGPKADLLRLVSGTRRSLRRVPLELLVSMFEFLSFRDLGRMPQVSKAWGRAANTDMLWARIHRSLRLVNEADTDAQLLGVGASHDPLLRRGAPPQQLEADVWSSAVGVRRRGGTSHKAQVMRYVLATRRSAVAALDAASTEYRVAATRLSARSEATGGLTQRGFAELSLDVPRLKATVEEAEATLSQQASRASAFEDQQSHLSRVLREAQAVLARTQTELRGARTAAEQQEHRMRRRVHVEAFERRAAQAVVHPLTEIPLALRRGIDSLGALELLAAQMPANDALQRSMGIVRTVLGLADGSYWLHREAYLLSTDSGQQIPTEAALRFECPAHRIPAVLGLDT